MVKKLASQIQSLIEPCLGIGIADPDGILKLFVIKEHGYASLFWQYSQGHGSSSQS